MSEDDVKHGSLRSANVACRRAYLCARPQSKNCIASISREITILLLDVNMEDINGSNSVVVPRLRSSCLNARPLGYKHGSGPRALIVREYSVVLTCIKIYLQTQEGMLLYYHRCIHKGRPHVVVNWILLVRIS